MSDVETTSTEPEAIELPADGTAAFSALMDALVDSSEFEATGEGAAASAPTGAGDGSPAPGNQGTPATAGEPTAPTSGDPAQPGVAPAAGGAGDGTDVSGSADATQGLAGAGSIDAATLEPKWGEVLSGLEERQNRELHAAAVEEIRTEFSGYVDILNSAPSLIVGKEVPDLQNPEKMKQIYDRQDAENYQKDLNQILSKEVQDRAIRAKESVQGSTEALHSSVELFRANPDIIPFTKTFDKELADQFTELTKDYQLRVDGKFLGFTVPVQPLLTQLRQRLTAQRSQAAPSAPAAAEPSAQQQRAATQPRTDAGTFAPPPGPQAGIVSKAGNSGDGAEDFGTLFGTMGLPDFRI